MNGVLQQADKKQRSNPMLDQIAEQAEQNVPEKLKREFLSIMTVGGKLMWSEEMADERAAFDQAVQQSGDIPTVVAHAVIKIISIIQNESKREQPLESVGLAAPIFMSHILQYVEAKHGMPVTKEIIDETAQLMQVNLLKLYGVTEQHVQELIRSRSAEPQGGGGPRPGPLADGREMREEAPEEERVVDEEEEA